VEEFIALGSAELARPARPDAAPGKAA